MFEHKSFLQFIEHCLKTKQDIVALTIVETQGSTYRKPGTMMLVSSQHESMGVLSGGCIEEAMIQCCDEVLKQRYGKIVTHDLRLPDDSKASWEAGVGCNGLIQVWLEPFYAQEGYGALGEAVIYAQEGISKTWIRSTEKEKASEHRFIDVLLESEIVYNEEDHFIVQKVNPIYSLLVLGIGLQTQALVDIATVLGWEVTVCDTRKEQLNGIANADHKHGFQEGKELQELLLHKHFDAAVIMSHEFKNDLIYLKALIPSKITYIGLLGAKKRTHKMIEIAKENGVLLDNRLHAPVGLDLGSKTPQGIALAICAEIEAMRNRKYGLLSREHYANNQ